MEKNKKAKLLQDLSDLFANSGVLEDSASNRVPTKSKKPREGVYSRPKPHKKQRVEVSNSDGAPLVVDVPQSVSFHQVLPIPRVLSPGIDSRNRGEELELAIERAMMKGGDFRGSGASLFRNEVRGKMIYLLKQPTRKTRITKATSGGRGGGGEKLIKRVEPRGLSGRKLRQLGLGSKAACENVTFEDALHLHEEWKSYVNGITMPRSRHGALLELVRSLDYCGSWVVVTRSLTSGMVGIRGVLLMERPTSWVILGADERFRRLPKASCVLSCRVQGKVVNLGSMIQ